MRDIIKRTENRLKTHKEWAKNNPDKMRKYWREIYYKRREWGFIPLMDNPFPNNIAVDFHHVYPPMPFAVPLPRVVHLNHNMDIEKHIAHNKEWFEKLYSMEVDSLLGLKPLTQVIDDGNGRFEI